MTVQKILSRDHHPPIPRSSFSETATTVPIGVTTTSRSSTGSEIGDPDSNQPKSRGRPSQSLPTHPSGVAAILKLSRNIRYFPNNDLFLLTLRSPLTAPSRIESRPSATRTHHHSTPHPNPAHLSDLMSRRSVQTERANKDAETLRLPSGSPDLTGTDDRSSEPNPGLNLTESYSIPPKHFPKGGHPRRRRIMGGLYLMEKPKIENDQI